MDHSFLSHLRQSEFMTCYVLEGFLVLVQLHTCRKEEGSTTRTEMKPELKFSLYRNSKGLSVSSTLKFPLIFRIRQLKLLEPVACQLDCLN